MSTPPPVGLTTIPPEITLAILSHLPRKKDWLSLARTCRRVAGTVAAEVTRASVSPGDSQSYSCWYACVHADLNLLRRHISYSPAVINHHFPSSAFLPKRRRITGEDGHPCVVSAGKRVPDGSDMTPLTIAIIAGHSSVVQELLDNGADPNLTALRPSGLRALRCPIHWAVLSQHPSSVAIIEALGKHAADLNREQQDDDNTEGFVGNQRIEKCAPIFLLLMLQKPRLLKAHTACQTTCEMFNNDFKRLQKLRLAQLGALLKSGADPNVQYHGSSMTPMLFLISSLREYSPSFYFDHCLQSDEEDEEQAEMVNKIVTSFLDTLRSFGSDLNKPGDIYSYWSAPDRRTPPEPEDVQVSLEANHKTPLHLACRLVDVHKKALITWLMINGARPDGLTAEGTTVLMEYCRSRFEDVHQFRRILYLKCHVHVNFTDNQGRTALHHLCANPMISPRTKMVAIKSMLKALANPTVVDEENCTPSGEIEKTQAYACRFESSIHLLKQACRDWKAHVANCSKCQSGGVGCGGGGQLLHPRSEDEIRPGPFPRLRPNRCGPFKRGAPTPNNRGSPAQSGSNRGSLHQSPSHRDFPVPDQSPSVSDGSSSTDINSSPLLTSDFSNHASSSLPQCSSTEKTFPQGSFVRQQTSAFRKRYPHLGGLDLKRISEFPAQPPPMNQGPSFTQNAVRAYHPASGGSQADSSRGVPYQGTSIQGRPTYSTHIGEASAQHPDAARGDNQSFYRGAYGNGRGRGRGGRGGCGGRGGRGGRGC